MKEDAIATTEKTAEENLGFTLAPEPVWQVSVLYIAAFAPRPNFGNTVVFRPNRILVSCTLARLP
jgi:hypothetical protein